MMHSKISYVTIYKSQCVNMHLLTRNLEMEGDYTRAFIHLSPRLWVTQDDDHAATMAT